MWFRTATTAKESDLPDSLRIRMPRGSVCGRDAVIIDRPKQRPYRRRYFWLKLPPVTAWDRMEVNGRRDRGPRMRRLADFWNTGFPEMREN